MRPQGFRVGQLLALDPLLHLADEFERRVDSDVGGDQGLLQLFQGLGVHFLPAEEDLVDAFDEPATRLGEPVAQAFEKPTLARLRLLIGRGSAETSGASFAPFPKSRPKNPGFFSCSLKDQSFFSNSSKKPG